MKDVSQVGYTNVAEALIETVPDLRALCGGTPWTSDASVFEGNRRFLGEGKIGERSTNGSDTTFSAVDFGRLARL
jgi:hypothetical protein